MNKSQLKTILIAKCPPIPVLRKYISDHEIHRFTRHVLPEEDVRKIENNKDEINRVVAEASVKWAKRVRNDNSRIDVIMQKAPDYCALPEEQQEEIRQDMLFCRFAYGFMPDEYVCYHFSDKTPEERREFISESEHMQYVYSMNDPVDICIFNDKMETYKRYGKYYHRQIISVSSEKDYNSFLNYIDKHPVFVKKQVFESCGNSIEKIDMNTCGKTPRDLFESFLSQGKVVMEELVIQNPVTEVFNQSTVNTIRCITMNTGHGILAPYCFMKVGRKGFFVDNGGAGGILVGLDEKTGITNTDGYDELRNIYKTHPDSGTEFMGHQLPEWDTALAICKEMAAQTPSVRYIGWDLAYTRDFGWVVIEGNGMSQFIGPQTVWQRGIKREVKKIMQDM